MTASQLHPNDTILRDGLRVTLIRVRPIECGYVELIWGGGTDDRAVLAGDALVERVDA